MPASGAAIVKAANLIILEMSLKISQTPHSLPSQGIMSPKLLFVSASAGAKKINKTANEANAAKILLIFLFLLNIVAN